MLDTTLPHLADAFRQVVGTLHSEEFAGDATVPEARHFVTGLLPDAEDPDVRDTAELLVSEVVTNARTHAAPGPVTVSVALDEQHLVISVHDPGGALIPCARAFTDDGVHGRGLRLVDTLAKRWGFSRDADGTDVWFWLARGLP